MKIKFVVAAMLLGNVMLQNNVNAQSAIIPVKATHYNKHHFIVGTNLLNYTEGISLSKNYQNGVISDSVTNKFHAASAALNFWAGYFVSEKLCLGIGFTSYGSSAVLLGNTGIITPFPYITPSNLMFRYYLLTGDSNKVDVYMQGIVGASYSSFGSSVGSNDQYPPSNNSNSTTSVTNMFNVGCDLILAIQINVTKHIGINAGVGGACGYQSYNVPSYVENTGGTPYTVPASKTLVSQVEFAGTFGLQYKI